MNCGVCVWAGKRASGKKESFGMHVVRVPVGMQQQQQQQQQQQ
jgi:hypothetical protein